ASILLPDGFENGTGINSLVDVKRNGRHSKTSALCFSRPLQRWVKMRVVGVGAFRFFRIGFRRHQTDGRVIRPLLAVVPVLSNWSFLALRAFYLCHGVTKVYYRSG